MNISYELKTGANLIERLLERDADESDTMFDILSLHDTEAIGRFLDAVAFVLSERNALGLTSHLRTRTEE